MIVILHNIRSLHNVGSIFRTADAVGIKKIYLCGITPAPVDKFGRLRQQLTKVSLGAEHYVEWEKVKAVSKLIDKLKKQKYKISKKALQLEARRVAKELKHLPTRKELSQYGKYPIEYYDQYFVSWGEVCAAARTTGMTEHRLTPPLPPAIPQAKREAQEEFCWYED